MADFDFGDALGSAASGALTGSAFGVPGAIAGGLFGLGSSLLSPKKKKKQFNDPYAAQRATLINELSNSNTGAQAAALASRQTGNLARDRMEQLANGPFAGNASVQSGLSSDILREADATNAQARIAGAAQDQNAKLQAGSLMGQGSQMAQNQYQFDALNPEKPSFGESALQNILSYGSGLGLSKLTNPPTTTTTDVQTKTLPNRPNVSAFDTPLPEAQGASSLLSGLLDQPTPENPSYTPQMLDNERMGGFGGAEFEYDGGSSFDWLSPSGASSPFQNRSVSDIVYGRY